MTIDKIGPYQLIRRLGSGGMGEVWMAQRAGLGGASKHVALKLLRHDHLDNDKLRLMFLGEARLAMLLNNSNIVQVFDVGEDEQGGCYMAMEWVDGLDLAQLTRALWSRGEQLPQPLIAYIIGELLKALACAHDFVHEGKQRTIVHRDVTPHNVMLSVWGEVKIMDFGVARMASEETSGLHAKGKLRYMPPEQLVDEARTPTIDLFTVGGILHELLDGRGFREAVVDEARLFGMVIRGEVDPLRAPNTVPPELETLRRGLLAAAVEDRIPSARDAHQILARWPGYRDARFELQDLVRQLTRSQSPIQTADPNAHTTALTRQFEGTGRSASVRTSVKSHAPTRDSSSAQLRSSERRNPSLALRALALGGLVSGLGGAAIAWHTYADRPTVEALAFPTLLDDPAPTKVAPRVPWLDRPPPPPDDIQPEPEPEPEPKPKPKPSSKRSPARAKQEQVGVTVRAPDFFFVEIRVGTKRVELDKMVGRRANIKLDPGRYSVDYREDPHDEWRHAGFVELNANTPTLVKLGQDASLTVIE
ncbi:Serine/threonine-protein kinase pkn6 [Enhygromyxa salina]|uniref:Serine/threonine-protein kinase pkn6 n=1 Tax=Enhygromyxa salina TaxID=215803 RepID=A0A2S9XFK6_9BACT|nr:serine/threonine-protein kinase [Enhygromyxa salina]PRP91461.1 Serine/threonine-protein kinase pkn6 [Enhygromyxa salina]